jgi:hypothetical protein
LSFSLHLIGHLHFVIFVILNLSFTLFKFYSEF